jgi:hypothetical protein
MEIQQTAYQRYGKHCDLRTCWLFLEIVLDIPSPLFDRRPSIFALLYVLLLCVDTLPPD